LRKQAESRGIHKVTTYGRIYRVTHESTKPFTKPQLTKASSSELVEQLADANGWRRDTAQRLLIERNDASVVSALQTMASSHTNELARLHALWTLEGLMKIDAGLLSRALDDKHSKVRAAAVRLTEPLLRVASPQTDGLRKKLLMLVADKTADVQIQLALTLGEVAPDDASKTALKSLAQSEFALAKAAANFSTASREAKPIANATPKGPKLSAAELKRFEAGKGYYEVVCLPCHQPHGLGQEGLAPPLVGSEWVSGSEKRLVRIVLNGLRGPIQVKGQTHEMDMPALGILDDEQIATVLTYVRNEWGNSYAPVSTNAVKQVRDATADRNDAWTQEELLKIK
jgi:mono/diheme cytochrome c family protein